MKQRPRPLERKLDPRTYDHDKVVQFTVGKTGSPDSQTLDPVEIPIPLCYRLYHLGRAYDFPRVIAIHPEGRIYIDYVHGQTLGLELELLLGLVDDNALSYHVRKLIDLIAAIKTDTSCNIIMKAPGY